jgi:hypothetical protein
MISIICCIALLLARRRVRARASTSALSRQVQERTSADATATGEPTKRWQIAFPAILALIAALSGALIGGVASRYQQNEQFRVQGEVEVRKFRADSYLDYLKNVGEESDLYADWYTRCSGYTTAREISRCRGDLKKYAEVRSASNHALNNIFVYGSGDTIQAATDMNSQLVDLYTISLQGDPVEFLPRYKSHLDSLNRLRVLICRDVNPAPDRNCIDRRSRASPEG